MQIYIFLHALIKISIIFYTGINKFLVGDKMVSVDEFAISTANDIPGFRIVETKGFIYGLTVRSRGAGGQIGAGIKSLFGGEITQYVKMMEESREEALHRAIAHARELGANGIVAIRFDSNEISDVMQEILVYGTAVVVQKE